MSTDNATITFDSSTDALFRVWGLRISQALATCGMVQTADTGQINWTTITRTISSTGESVQGYEMWRFNDSLQATKPVFMKIEYGIAINGYGGTNNMPHQPVLFVTVGTVTNGAGTLTGTTVSPRTRLSGNSGAANAGSGNTISTNHTPSSSSPCYFSGDGSSLQMALGITSAAQSTWTVATSGTGVPLQFSYSSFPAFLGLERTRDAAGAPTGDGVVHVITCWNPAAATSAPGTNPTSSHQVLSFLPGYNAAALDAAWPIAWPGQGFGTANFGGDIYFHPMVAAVPKPSAQLLGWLGTWKSDVPILAPLVVTVDGTSHTYISLAGIAGTSPSDNSRSRTNLAVPNGALMMRYE